jgi:hypothetical protein
MKRSLMLVTSAVVILTACAPAATPTAAPAQPTTAPAAQPTQAPAPTALPELKPPISGGKTNPPTLAPTAPRSQPNTTNRVTGWQQLGSSITPPARYDHALVFAGDFNRMVMFGGRSPALRGDTWVYDLAANAWHAVTSTASPNARFSMGAAYDPVHQRAIIFGGQTATGFFNDVWAFDFATEQWSRINTAGVAPTARSGSAAVVDAPFNQLIVSHGLSAQGPADDSWSLDLGTNVWQDISPLTRPSKRSLSSAALDEIDHRLILFGGRDAAGQASNDQWSLDPTLQAWRQFGTIGPNNPAPRWSSTLVYDPATHNLYLFGGQSGSAVNNEVWRLDLSNTWLLLASNSGPSARSEQGAAWDSINNRMLVFGGVDANGNALNDLWAYTP